MKMETYVFNIGLNKGKSKEQIKRDDLWRAMVKLAQGYNREFVTRICVDIPEGQEYADIYGVKVYEPTDIYLIKSHWISTASVQHICAQFEQDAIPVAVYDECLRPVHTELIYSEDCEKSKRYEWGLLFDPTYFATPIKGDLSDREVSTEPLRPNPLTTL